MAGRLPQAWLDELRDRADIVQVVSRYVQLNPKGGRYWGLCPFHGEKTPSFSVNPQRQMYYCFGCHAGGSAITFVMEMEHLDFMEAVKLLASTESILLDPLYSGKAMAGLIDLVRKDYFPEGSNVLFLHTGGSPALFAYLDTFRP